MGNFSQTILQVVGGGGIVALLGFITFLIRRGPDLRSVDRTSGATALDAQTNYIQALQSGELSTRAELTQHVKTSNEEKNLLLSQLAASQEALAISQSSLARVLREMAVVQTDLDISSARINELTKRVSVKLKPPEI